MYFWLGIFGLGGIALLYKFYRDRSLNEQRLEIEDLYPRIVQALIFDVQSRISYRAHEMLDPAPTVVNITGPLNVENVMKIVRSQLLWNDSHDVVERILSGFDHLEIWDRIFIHDAFTGILDIRTGKNDATICIRI